MKVIKRDGRAVEYNSEKIAIAIEKANKEVTSEKRATTEEISQITNYIETLDRKRILVEDIQDIIEQKLMELGKYELAKKYIVYRYTRALVRKQNTTDESILGLIKNSSSISNGKESLPVIASVQRNLIAGEVSKDLTKRMLLPEKITNAHEQGILHFHATDYFLQPIINSCLVNIGDMLENGTVINDQKIESPKSFQVACIVITQIIAAIASSQYGEQYINVKHLGKYLRKSYNKIKAELKELDNCNLSDEVIEKITCKRLQNELSAGVQTIQYQINTLITTYGKAPLVTLILELDTYDEYAKENAMIIEEFFRQRYEEMEKADFAVKNSMKLIYYLKEENNKQNEKYKYLTELAEKCLISINPQDMKKYTYEGFFNQGVVSINLPQIGIISDGNEENFWKLLDERLNLCYEALMCRHYALLGTISDVSPIHWKYGAIARLNSGERIDKLLKDGYSTISLGYVGIDEVAELMAGGSNDKVNVEKFSLKLVRYLEDVVQKWRKMTGLGFDLCMMELDCVCFRFGEINKELIKNGCYNSVI